MSTPNRDQVEELALELEGQDPPGESYLEAVNRIQGAWSTAREMLAQRPTPPATDPTLPEDRLV